jgi:hypothetical protein
VARRAHGHPREDCTLRLIEDARSIESVQAENLFLRRQLALYIGRGIQPQPVDAATRVSLAVLARLFDWRGALFVVQPATMIRWHRAGWRMVLAIEVPSRSSSDPKGTAQADSPDGAGESRLGRRANRQ